MTVAITLARQYLANLQTTAGDSKLHEAIALLSGVLAALDEQKPVAYVSAKALQDLKSPMVAGIGCGLNKAPGTGMVAIYTTLIGGAP